ERVPRTRPASLEGDAVTARPDHRQAHTGGAEELHRWEPGRGDHAIDGPHAPARSQRDRAVAAPAPGELTALACLAARLAQPPGETRGQLLRADEPVDCRMQSRDHLRRIERRLELDERRGVELVDRAALMTKLAKLAKDVAVRVDSVRGAGRDDEPRHMHLES